MIGMDQQQAPQFEAPSILGLLGMAFLVVVVIVSWCILFVAACIAVAQVAYGVWVLVRWRVRASALDRLLAQRRSEVERMEASSIEAKRARVMGKLAHLRDHALSAT